MLFWVDEAILESTLGRKKLRMRTNCKGRTFLNVKKKKKPVTLYSLPSNLKRKSQKKSQSKNFALPSSCSSSQFYKWVITYNFFATLAVWHMAKVRTTWKNEAQGARFFTHMGSCDSFWHQEFVHEIQHGKAKQLLLSTPVQTSANWRQLCKEHCLATSA